MGLSEVNFLRRNCIFVELKLFYQTLFPPKELYWNHRITTELRKFSTIKYARPTFAISKGTFQRTTPRIDLILASSDVHKLATVLFNLRAFIVNGKDEKPTVTKSTDIPSHEDYNLEQKYDSLLNAWRGEIDTQDSSFLQVQPDTNLLFVRTPVDFLDTTEGEHVNMSSEEFFRLREKQHERSDNDGVTEHSQSPARIKDGKYGSNLIQFKPSLYYNYSSLPANMKLWLNGLEDSEMSLMKIDEKSTENLDILLHGFKGFPDGFGKKG